MPAVCDEADVPFGNPHKAIELYDQARLIAREISDRRCEANALGNLGVAYKNLGDATKSNEFCEQQMLISRELGDRKGEAAALFNSAVAMDILGHRADAISRAEAALKIFEQTEDPNVETVRRQIAEWCRSASKDMPVAQEPS